MVWAPIDTREYQAIRGYAVEFDCWVTRVSMADRDGAEHWMQIKDRHRKKWSIAERKVAVDFLEASIKNGDPPGELKPDEGEWLRAVKEKAGGFNERER